jgi:integrase/recombinase XerD
MRAQRVLMPVTGVESWTVVDQDFGPVEAAERYLAFLSSIERSPNTVRAYAHSLALWLEFLALRRTDWASAGVEDVSRFVSWLRAPAGNVIVLDAATARRSEATVNRHLAGVFGFYDFHARTGVALAESLVAWRRRLWPSRSTPAPQERRRVVSSSGARQSVRNAFGPSTPG